MSTENKKVVRRLVEEFWNNRQAALADELVSASCRNNDPQSPDTGTGPEGLRRLMAHYTTAFPDLRFRIEDIIAEGDRVVVRMASSGTHRAELMGIQPTGRQVAVSITATYKLSNGRIIEGWVNWDALGMLQQLGATTAPPPRARSGAV